jgi:hypothetical protein
MNLDAAKAALCTAEGDAERHAAVNQALQAGMPLAEIQDYLDWIDALRAAALGRPKPGWFAGILGMFRIGKRSGEKPD